MAPRRRGLRHRRAPEEDRAVCAAQNLVGDAADQKSRRAAAVARHRDEVRVPLMRQVDDRRSGARRHPPLALDLCRAFALELACDALEILAGTLRDLRRSKYLEGVAG